MVRQRYRERFDAFLNGCAANAKTRGCDWFQARTDMDPRRAEAQSERTVEALIDAGRAAVNAGATDAGVETLRRAVDEADAISSAWLHARALLALGGALVHFPRGRDGEGATILHAAVAAASKIDAASMVSEGCRELGYVEYLRGRYDRADVWLERAVAEAPDEVDRATAMGVLGAARSDEGRRTSAARPSSVSGKSPTSRR